MAGITEALRCDLSAPSPEFAEGYAESFLNTYIAAQIKTIRQQRKMTQGDLAAALGTTQTVISRIENVNYAGWNIGTLKKLARAFDVRLQVSFEEYGTLPEEVETFSRERLMRAKRTDDPRLKEKTVATSDLAPLHQYMGVLNSGLEALAVYGKSFSTSGLNDSNDLFRALASVEENSVIDIGQYRAFKRQPKSQPKAPKRAEVSGLYRPGLQEAHSA